MTETRPAPSSTREGIDRAFNLPEILQGDRELVDLYESIVLNLRTEARGIPMNTVQTLLLERIAFNYVLLKRGEREGDLTPNQVKDLTKFWLDMTTEFNKQLAAGHEKLREALLLSISDMVVEKIGVVKDPEIHRTLLRELSEGFAEMGL